MTIKKIKVFQATSGENLESRVNEFIKDLRNNQVLVSVDQFSSFCEKFSIGGTLLYTEYLEDNNEGEQNVCGAI